MKLLMNVNDFLVLRDGHPFGDIGVVEGYSKSWPLPQTIVGMLRSKIGFTMNENYFADEQNKKDIFNYGLKRQIPVLNDDIKKKNDFLFPVPADLIFTKKGKDENLTASVAKLKESNDDCGTDIQNRDWIIPSLDIKEKPAKETPFFLYNDVFTKYLKEELNETSGNIYQFGCSKPYTDGRLHNAIDSGTLTTKKGQLYSNKGLYFQTKLDEDKIGNIKLLLELEGDFSGIDLKGDAYLGGERKTVNLQQTTESFPQCPNIFENQKYLKLIMATHGDFGGWCPDWLKPDLEKENIEWVKMPGTDFKVRLRSAYVGGHDIVSGWDYVARGPKVSKKLVQPGAVYVIEVKNTQNAQEIAKLFWGNSIDKENRESSLSGYNLVIVGNASKSIIN